VSGQTWRYEGFAAPVAEWRHQTTGSNPNAPFCNLDDGEEPEASGPII
jgi:hypothetical protein